MLYLEEISHARIVSLIYKLFTSIRGSDDLSIGFDRSRDRTQRDLNYNKNISGECHVRNYLNMFPVLLNIRKQKLMVSVTNQH